MEGDPHMKNKIQTALTLWLSMAAPFAMAHPGPHNHAAIVYNEPHAWLGWEAALILVVIAGAIVLWRGRDRQR